MTAPIRAHVPLRTCVGCRRRRPQGELLRVAVAGDGTPTVGRRAPGRGAWVCQDGRCSEQAARTRGFQRSLRRPFDESALVTQLPTTDATAGDTTPAKVR